MPFKKLVFTPGVNTQATQTLNANGYSLSNLIRWLNGGYLQKYGGWQRLTSSPFAGLVRAMHAYENLNGESTLMVGSDGGAQVYVNGVIYDLLISRKTSVLQQPTNGTTGPIVCTSGSKVVTVTDVGHGATVGSQVYLAVPLSLGGTTLYPQVITVDSVVDADNWTFQLASNAGSSNTFGSPNFTCATANGATVEVFLDGHGLSTGDPFVVNYDVEWNVASGATPVIAGTYTATVDSSNTFQIQSPRAATGSALGFEYQYIATTSSVVFDYLTLAPADYGNWFIDNFGNNGIFSYTNSPIYQYIPTNLTLQSGVIAQLDNAPTINAGSFVAMPQAQIIAFGSETIIGSGVQDPLLLRWCGAGDNTVWIADSDNQAGSYRLSRGSRIIGGIQAPQTTLIFTDVDVWSMSYIGGQFVYSFTVMGSGCGLISANARAVVGRTTYWMSLQSFWTYGDSAVQPLNCDVYDEVFGDLDTANSDKCFAGANAAFNEVAFFYPSLSGGTGEVDSYVKFNTLSSKWDYGKLGRTAYIDAGIFGPPLSADLNRRVQKQEVGYDDDTVAMTGAFAETGFAEIGEGEDLMFVDQVIPDFNWEGVDGFVEMTIYGCNFPGETPQKYGPFTVTPETRKIPVRLRHRLVAFRWEWGDALGFNARIGAPMVRFAPAGRQ